MQPGHRQYVHDSVNDGRFNDALERQISTLCYERLPSSSDGRRWRRKPAIWVFVPFWAYLTAPYLSCLKLVVFASRHILCTARDCLDEVVAAASYAAAASSTEL
jgi:hypothetical protein